MGVPAFFRWLSRKYPAIVVHCFEESTKSVDGVNIPNDTSKPNPNNVEFDNLYLDMNGIIHPCCHPENKPAPKNEDEMMVLIFEYIDRIFNIVRPRKLLYMAIDGVAPRAKMNQQRSRRFRASKESVEKVDEMAKIRNELEIKGADLPPPKPKGEHFDSNCITPGTPFMARLAACLHYYVHDRLNNDPGWKNMKVILSDANGPGEGEHKIMDYIRRQRANPDHDPNTHHCLCGADADLIMLGLATHEPNFTIIREEFKPNQPRPCELCAQIGHTMQECTGLAKEKSGQFDEISPLVCEDTQFIFIKLSVLREYLEKDLLMTGLSFPYEFERALDDWVFMCFFVGNDFLPHLPSLEIREGAIDRLIRLYKDTVNKTGGYLTDSGIVFMERVQMILTNLGEAEDEIFKKRQENELNFRRRQKDRKKREKLMSDRPAWTPTGQFQPVKAGSSPFAVQDARRESYNMRMHGQKYHTDAKSRNDRNVSTDSVDSSNHSSAQALWAMLKKSKAEGEQSSKESNPAKPDGDAATSQKQSAGDNQRGQKRKAESQNDPDSEEEPSDEVRLWEDGWKERYYESKFGVSGDTSTFRHKLAHAYVEGLCWVLRYYYQGCPSWKWFFPYHYAPFASDFVNIADLKITFEKNTKPFSPMEQLMGVFPAASKNHIPDSFGHLMDDPKSPIIDFYPEDFKVDLNGKKYAWQGVALLPFVDEKRLLTALQDYYPMLSPEEQSRNKLGDDLLYVRKGHDSYGYLTGLYEGSNQTDNEFDIDPSLLQGVKGTALIAKNAVLENRNVVTPISSLDDINGNQVICVKFRDPKYGDDFIFPAKRLPGAKEPGRVLKPEDFDRRNSDRWQPRIGMAPHKRGSLGGSGHRTLNHAMHRQRQDDYRGYNQGYAGQNRNGGGGGGQYRNYNAPGAYSLQQPNPQVQAHHYGADANRSYYNQQSYNQHQRYGSGGYANQYGGDGYNRRNQGDHRYRPYESGSYNQRQGGQHQRQSNDRQNRNYGGGYNRQ